MAFDCCVLSHIKSTPAQAQAQKRCPHQMPFEYDPGKLPKHFIHYSSKVRMVIASAHTANIACK